MTPRVKVEVSGRHRSVSIDAIVDTGFDGDISLPIKIAIDLGLELVATSIFELADGSRTEELIFSGRARLAGKTKRVDILVSDSQDTLIGTRLLEDCRLAVDFQTGKVQIVHKKRASA